MTVQSLQLTADLLRARAGGLARYVDGLARTLDAFAPTRVVGIGGTNGGHPAAAVTSPLPLRLKTVRRRVRDLINDTDVIASHFALYAVSVLDLLRARPHVLHFHGPWASESAAEGAGALSVAAKRFVERRVYATADRAITLSKSFAKILIEDYRVPEESVRVIPGGIELPTSPLVDRSAARVQLGWPADRPIVVCVRRLARRMGLDVLIDAARIVRQSHPDVLFAIAGKGAIQRELEEQIEAASLLNHVRLLGFVPDELLPLAYAAADLSVVPSQAFEGFGFVTLESLVQGTPVLVTPVGGLPEVVTALDTSLIMPGSDSRSIGDAVSRALSTPARLPCRNRCRAYAVDHFGWPGIADRVLDVYREAIATCGK